MVAPKVGNNTLVEKEIFSEVALIEFLCSVYFKHYYLRLPHCVLGIVESHTAHLLKQCRLALVEIPSSTSYVNTR